MNSWPSMPLLNRLNRQKIYLVAISGGPDSVALTSLLIRSGFKNLILCHVNYQARMDANNDEQIVQQVAARFKMPLLVLVCKPTKTLTEAHARTIRYNFFEQIQNQYQALGIFIAHHEEDALETFIWQQQTHRLSRHCGLSSISNYKKLLIYRPLLLWTKPELLAWLHRLHLPYGFDSTNKLPLYWRNRLRLQPDYHQQLLQAKEVYRETYLTNELNHTSAVAFMIAWMVPLQLNNLNYFKTLNKQTQKIIIHRWLWTYAPELIYQRKKSLITEIWRLIYNRHQFDKIIIAHYGAIIKTNNHIELKPK